MSKNILGSIGLAVMFSLSACLEGILGTDEEKTTQSDTTMVGTWYGYSISVDGVMTCFPATMIINEDGTGFYNGIYDATQEPDSGDFTWKIVDGKVKSAFDDGTFYTSDYSINNGVLTLSYTEDGQSITEIYVKYRGNHPTEMVGKWIQVRKTTGGVYDPTLMTAVLSSDGNGISYEVESAADTSVNVYNFSWSISGDYMIILPSNGNNLAEVNILAKSSYLVNVTRLNSAGETVVATLIKDISEKDTALLGNWTLTGATLNNVSQSINGSATFANDGSGIISYSVITVSFNWFTCSGWLFTYMPARPEISTSYYYLVSGNTLTLTLSSQGSGSENVLVLTFTKA
jgi:hypothetical protein